MNKEDAIKYLQQLYPQGGHCWLDEQRIEAIRMAIESLSHSVTKKSDQVERIRAEIERLKSNLIHGACASQIAMETRCKEEAYNEVLALLDTMQEEPVNRTPADVESAMQEVEEKSRVFTEAHKGEDADTILAQMRGEEPVSKELEEAAKNHAVERYRATRDMVLAEKCKWSFKAGAEWQKTKDESTTEDLGEYINELSKQFPEVSFAKLSRIAVRVAKWQKEKLWKPADGDNLPEIDREVVVLIKYNTQRNIHDEEYPTYRVGFGHRPNPNGWDGKDIDTNDVTHYTTKLYDKGGWNAPNIVYWLDARLPYEEK